MNLRDLFWFPPRFLLINPSSSSTRRDTCATIFFDIIRMYSSRLHMYPIEYIYHNRYSWVWLFYLCKCVDAIFYFMRHLLNKRNKRREENEMQAKSLIFCILDISTALYKFIVWHIYSLAYILFIYIYICFSATDVCARCSVIASTVV